MDTLRHAAHNVARFLRRPDGIASVVLFLAVVLAMPVWGFLSSESQRATAVQVSPEVAKPSHEYRRLETREFKVGWGPGDIAPTREVGEAGPAETLSWFMPTAQGELWLFDWADGVRLRRFDSSNRVTAQFKVPNQAALSALANDGTLWVLFAAGGESGTELIRHYTPDGRMLREYPLPQGLLARAITLDSGGGVWVQHEEAEIDSKTFASTYVSRLVPIVRVDLEPVKDPAAGVIDGNFFGADGWLYHLQISTIEPDKDFTELTYTVRASSPGGARRSYALPVYHRPFAADSSGRVYSEPVGAPPVVDAYRNSVGESPLDSLVVLATAPEGQYAQIQVRRPLSVIGISSAACITSEGQLWTATLAEGSYLFHKYGEAVALQPDPETVPPAELAIQAGTAPLSMDPYAAPDPQIRDVMRLVHSGLARQDGAGRYVPDVAERIPSSDEGISSDGLTISYEIKSGLKWHDGRDVTGEDVVATWRYLQQPSAVLRPSPFAGFENITSVKADGLRVTVRLNKPFGPAPESFFPYVLPAHWLTDSGRAAAYWGQPIGCGPYRLISSPSAAGWQLQAHDESPRGQVTLERLDVRFGTDDSALASFQSSQVPVLWQWPKAEYLSTLRRDATGEATRVATGRWVGIILNPDKVPSLALRRRIVSTYPIQEVRDLLPIESDDASPRLFAAASATVSVSAYDGAMPSDTRFDYGGGFRFHWPEVPYEQMLIVEAAWKKQGLSVHRFSGSDMFYENWGSAGVLARGFWEVSRGIFEAPPDPAWGGLFDPWDVPSRTNPCGKGVVRVDDPEVKAIHEQARATYDPKVRAALAEKLQSLLARHAVYAFDRAEYRTAVTLGDIEGYDPRPYPAGDFWNVESWALESDR